MGKNPDNYETIRDETNIYKQKPLNIDEFNDVEEDEVRERVKKRKEKRREVAEKKKVVKKKGKTRKVQRK